MSRARLLRCSGLAAALAVLWMLPLAEEPLAPLCGFHWLTGFPCPFCGLTRALRFLLAGDVPAAVRLHALSPLVLLGAVAAAVRPFPVPPKFWPAAAVIFGGYGVLRWFLP